jgi:hypothetical protein
LKEGDDSMAKTKKVGGWNLGWPGLLARPYLTRRPNYLVKN